MEIYKQCKCGCGRIVKPGNEYILGHNRSKDPVVIKIRRRCKCGCGRITKVGRRYIHGHNRRVIKIRRRCKCGCGQITNPGRKYIRGHNGKGCKHSEEIKLKRSISLIKYDPDYPYCDIWKDDEYKKDLRKDYCENIGCKGDYKRLVNHHIDLDKKNCHPSNIITLCNSRHIILHNKLQGGRRIIPDPKNFIIIVRSDHISYIDKRIRKKIIIYLKGGSNEGK